MLNTRGERNNNPGNLEFNSGITWQGQCDEQMDKPYLQFTDSLHGIRALAKDLLGAEERHGLKTVTDIIGRFAPASDHNDTGAYVENVAARMAVAPDDEIDLTSPPMLNAMVCAVIHQENGEQPYGPHEIAQAVDEALNLPEDDVTDDAAADATTEIATEGDGNADTDVA